VLERITSTIAERMQNVARPTAFASWVDHAGDADKVEGLVK
jgi:hypothetical protein